LINTSALIQSGLGSQVNTATSVSCRPKPKTYDELKDERWKLGLDINNLERQLAACNERVENIDKQMEELKPTKIAQLQQQIETAQYEIEKLKK
jgi:peptidoglycan hydrolase CwlO-like protein